MINRRLTYREDKKMWKSDGNVWTGGRGRERLRARSKKQNKQTTKKKRRTCENDRRKKREAKGQERMSIGWLEVGLGTIATEKEAKERREFGLLGVSWEVGGRQKKKTERVWSKEEERTGTERREKEREREAAETRTADTETRGTLNKTEKQTNKIEEGKTQTTTTTTAERTGSVKRRRGQRINQAKDNEKRERRERERDSDAAEQHTTPINPMARHMPTGGECFLFFLLLFFCCSVACGVGVF